jgi:hypothetical protein
MKKLFLLLAFVCSVSFSVSYAADGKDCNKSENVKVLNDVSQSCELITEGGIDGITELVAITSSCGMRAWNIYNYCLDHGYSSDVAWIAAKYIYALCEQE